MSTELVGSPNPKRQPARRHPQRYRDALAGVQAGIDFAVFDLADRLERDPSRVGKLTQSLAANETVKQQLNTSVQALLGNKDADAVAALNKLAAAK